MPKKVNPWRIWSIKKQKFNDRRYGDMRSIEETEKIRGMRKNILGTGLRRKEIMDNETLSLL